MKGKRTLQRKNKLPQGILLFFIVLVIGIFSVKAEASTGTWDNPEAFVFDKEINGTITDYTDDWYTFTLTKKSIITGEFQSNGMSFELCDAEGTVLQKITTSKSAPSDKIEKTLEAGTYKICIHFSSYTKTYRLKLSKQEFSWGTVKVTWNPNNLSAPCTIPVQVTLTGATEGVKIYRVGGNQGINSTTYSGQLRVNNAGEYTLDVELIYLWDSSYTITKKYPYTVKPGRAALSGYNMTVGKNLIVVRNDTGYNGVVNHLQFYEKGRWVSKASGTGTTSVSGLKPDKAYKIRVIKCYSKNGKQIWGAPSKVYTVYTATNKKPAIKSIKASNFKKKYIKKYWVSGYYDRGRKIWISGHWAGGYNMTTYKLKVTLKNKVPGLKTKYIRINGQLCKVKGKTYTVNESYKGNRKKKKITVKACAVKDKYGTDGAVTKKKITIR